METENNLKVVDTASMLNHLLAELPLSNILIVILLVLAIDKVFYNNNLEKMIENRKWHLPLISVVVGALTEILQNTFADFNVDAAKKALFEGMKVGAFSTVTYRIVKDAFIEKLNMIFGKRNTIDG